LVALIKKAMKSKGLGFVCREISGCKTGGLTERFYWQKCIWSSPKENATNRTASARAPEKMIKKSEENMYRKEKMKHQGWDLDRLAEYIRSSMGIKKESLKKRGRLNSLSYARGMLAYWGVEELGLKGIDVARFLGVERPAIDQMMKIGAEYISQTGLKLIN
jgi:hypothetical protein